MARTGSYLVMFLTVALALVAVSCADPEAGKPLYVDSSFTDEETASILQAIEVWNEIGREHVGYDLIDYRGRYSQQRRLDVNRDLGDGRNVVYKVEDEKTYGDFNLGDKGTSGLGFGSDIILFTTRAKAWVGWGGEECFFPLTAEKQGWTGNDEAYPFFLRYIMMHELGHWFGLWHDLDTASIMYLGYVDGESPDRPEEIDIRKICTIYGCEKEP